MTYFVYDDASGTLQYEMEGSGAVYPITNAYGFGAAGLAQRVQPTVSNRVTSFAYDPSGNTITRSLSSGTTTLPSGYPVEVALYDGYGYPKADVSCSVAYSTTTGPTSYTAGYSVGFGGQFGYYVENNTKLASADPRDRGLLLCTNRYYDPINARWLTRDPIGYDGDMNLYGYVQGNPVMAADPSGLQQGTMDGFTYDYWRTCYQCPPIEQEERAAFARMNEEAIANQHMAMGGLFGIIMKAGNTAPAGKAIANAPRERVRHHTDSKGIRGIKTDKEIRQSSTNLPSQGPGVDVERGDPKTGKFGPATGKHWGASARLGGSEGYYVEFDLPSEYPVGNIDVLLKPGTYGYRIQTNGSLPITNLKPKFVDARPFSLRISSFFNQ